jgi:hypothetical protein
MPIYTLDQVSPVPSLVRNMAGPAQTGITYLPGFWVKVGLTGGAQNAFAVSEQNPFGVDVIIERVIVDVTTLSATASAVLDVDIDGDGATGGDDILDGVPVGSGDSIGVFDSLNATDNGTNGEGKSWKWNKAGGTNDYLTAQILAAAGAALAGNLYAYCIPTE